MTNVLGQIAQGNNNASKLANGALQGLDIRRQRELEEARRAFATGTAPQPTGLLGKMRAQTSTAGMTPGINPSAPDPRTTLSGPPMPSAGPAPASSAPAWSAGVLGASGGAMAPPVNEALGTIAALDPAGYERMQADQRARAQADQKRTAEGLKMSAPALYTASQEMRAMDPESRLEYFRTQVAPGLAANGLGDIAQQVLADGLIDDEDVAAMASVGAMTGGRPEPVEAKFSNVRDVTLPDGSVARVGVSSLTGREEVIPGSNGRSTMRNDQVMQVGADGSVTVGPARSVETLSNGTRSKVEADIIDQSEILDTIQGIRAQVKPEFLEIPQRAGYAWDALREKFDSNSVDPADRKSLREFATFRADSSRQMSRVLNKLSGAAVSPAEEQRLKGFIPVAGTGVFDGDSFTQFESKAEAFERATKLALYRLNYFRTEGIKPGKRSFDSVSLDDMEQIVRRRRDRILSEIQAQQPEMPGREAMAEATKRAIAEFER